MQWTYRGLRFSEIAQVGSSTVIAVQVQGSFPKHWPRPAAGCLCSALLLFVVGQHLQEEGAEPDAVVSAGPHLQGQRPKLNG
jgi:hypothetical protein